MERRFITEEKYQKFKRYTVKPGDVIITIMGTTGRAAVVPEDIPLAISTKHLAVITVDRTRVDPEFLAQAFHSDPKVLGQIAAANRGAPDDGSQYYHHWLAALERLVASKGLLTPDALADCKEAWAEAYRHTPHGKPVKLEPST